MLKDYWAKLGDFGTVVPIPKKEDDGTEEEKKESEKVDDKATEEPFKVAADADLEFPNP